MQRKISKKILFFIILLTSPLVILLGFSSQPAVTVRVINSNMVRSLTEVANIVTNSTVLSKPMVLSAKKAPAKYDLLINSYMNSGSRFTGQLFGFRTGAFYLYEPLWRFSIWDYYHQDNQVCSSTQGSVNCARSSAANVNSKKDRTGRVQLVKNVAKNATIIEMMIDVLDDMYNCNFSRLENLFVSNVHDHAQLAGPAWNEYRTCSKSRAQTKTGCLKRQEEKCKNSSYVVSKVLRLTTGSYEKLLEKRKNLKLIHLFRNPFAIVNSRTESRGYPVKDFTSNAAVLCKKMLLDYEGGLRLVKQYPGRVKLVFYEDIKSNVEEKIEKLYEFIGMESNKDAVKKLNKVAPNKGISNTPTMSKTRVADNAHWWRSHMSFMRYQSVKSKCIQIMKLFNLTDFKDRQSLLNLSIPEINLPGKLRI